MLTSGLFTKYTSRLGLTSRDFFPGVGGVNEHAVREESAMCIPTKVHDELWLLTDQSKY